MFHALRRTFRFLEVGSKNTTPGARLARLRSGHGAFRTVRKASFAREREGMHSLQHRSLECRWSAIDFTSVQHENLHRFRADVCSQRLVGQCSRETLVEQIDTPEKGPLLGRGDSCSMFPTLYSRPGGASPGPDATHEEFW